MVRLQDSMCGNSSSKVLLVCNVAPEATELSETLSSLEFAQRAAQVCTRLVRCVSHRFPLDTGSLQVAGCCSYMPYVLDHNIGLYKSKVYKMCKSIKGMQVELGMAQKGRRPSKASTAGTPPLRLSSGRIAPAPGRKRHTSAGGKENAASDA